MQGPSPDKAKSDAARQEGNAAFKKGKWHDSIGHYTSAIIHNPGDAVAYGNRAQAFLKLDKYTDAERDCTSALERSRGNIKALYRRALARRGLERYGEAIQDLESLLKLDAQNETAREELDQVRELLIRENARKKDKPQRPLSPIRSSRTVASDEDDIPPKSIAASAAQKQSFTAKSPSSPVESPSTGTSASVNTTEEPKVNSFAALKKKRDERPTRVGGTMSTLRDAEAGSPQSTHLTPQQPPAIAERSEPPSNSSPVVRSKPIPPSAPVSALTPPTRSAISLKPPTDPQSTAPGTALLLLRAITPLAPDDAWSILSQYPTDNLPIILAPVLEPDSLAMLVNILHHATENGGTDDIQKAQGILQGLRGKPRMKMNVAMLNKDVRERARSIAGDDTWPV